MCEDEDFEYFVELYGAQEGYNVFKRTIAKYGHEQFIQHYQEVLVKVRQLY